MRFSPFRLGCLVPLLAVWFSLILGTATRAARLPEGFSEVQLVQGLTGATAMALAPDSRAFICEQTGALRVVKQDKLLPEPFVTVRVDSSWERGLLGVALDPDFPRAPYVYLNYISPNPYPHHRISRFTAKGDMAAPDSEVVLLEGDNQELLGGGVKNGHQGGAIHFGKDGKLYIAIGDQTAGAPAQDLKTFQGKMLRINADGTIPADNPFRDRTTGKYQAIWALGLRNPFTFAVQPGTGRIFINDVGGFYEEINEGAAGANYGWPTVDHGPTSDPRFRGPIHWYRESSITGGTFYNPPKASFPTEYVGKYFFNDYKVGWIKTLDPDDPTKVADFAAGLGERNLVDLQVDAEGHLYCLSRNAWVKDQDFRPSTGSLWKIRYTGNQTPASVAEAPRPQTVVAGGATYFRIAPAGTRPLRLQWQRNGVAVLGADTATYVLPSVTKADDRAQFRCVVSNAFGEAVSPPATLTVTPTDREVESARWGGFFLQPAPGTYTGPVRVRVTTEKTGAVIHYTTDGSAPTTDSPNCTEPLALERSTTVKLQAFADGKLAGKTITATFTIEGASPYGLPLRVPAFTVAMPPLPELAPRLLSKTGIFASLAELAPNPGIVPYTVNVPLWSDRAAKRRWFALPPGGRIDFAPTGEWTFPAGTVLVKHFDLPIDDTNPRLTRRLETRLLVVDGTGYGYGVTYRWSSDNTDAELLTTSQTETISIKTATGSRSQTWYYPSPADCLTCHTAAARFVLGVKTRQLHGVYTYPGTGVTDNQLRTWSYLGMFRQPLEEGKIATFRRLTALDDAHASLEQRARSYLDANCAHCHRPGNTLRANFDARYDTPMAQQNILNAATVSDSLGLSDPRAVAAGDVTRSMMYQRMRRSDNFRMPPLAMGVQDDAALAVLKEWIESLPSAAHREQRK
jgi:uncharacterized repeat protein (TIGR03806 family)